MTIDKNSAHITNGGAPSVNASFNAGFKVSGPEPLDSRVYVVSKELMLAWPDTLGKPYFGMSVLVLFNDTDAATGAHIWNSTTGEINRNLLTEANLRLERFVLMDPTNIHNDTAWTNEVGSLGSQGSQGTQGTQGTQGETGSQGADGSQGAQGPAGTNGTNGTNGADGSQGAQGAQGPAGTNGTNGTDGNCIWTTIVAPTTPNWTFTISNLSGPTGATPQVGDIIIYSYYRYTISSIASTTVNCTGRVSLRGATGTNGTNGADGAQGAQGAPGSTGNDGYGVYFTYEYHDEQTTTEDSVSFTYNEIVIANQDVKLKKGDLIVCKTGWVYMIDTFTAGTLSVTGHYVSKWIGATGDNGAQGAQGAQGPAGTNGTNGAAGKGMFRTSQSVTSTSTTANAVTFTYANITRNSRTLQVGDFILAPNGNLYMLDTGGSTPKGHYLYNIEGPAGTNGAPGERGYTLLYYREHLEDGWTLDENKFAYLSSTGDFKKSDFVIDPDGNLGYVGETDDFIYLTTIGGGSSSTHVFISNDAYIDGALIDRGSLPDPLGFGLNEGDTIISPEGKVGHVRYDSTIEGYLWSYIGDLPSTGGGGSGSQGAQGSQGTNGSNGLCMFTTTQNLTGTSTSTNAYTFTYNSIVRANRTIQVGDKIVSLPASNPSCNVYVVDSVSGTTIKGHYVSCLKGAQGAGGSGGSISSNTLDLTFYKYDGTTNVTHTFYVQ